MSAMATGTKAKAHVKRQKFHDQRRAMTMEALERRVAAVFDARLAADEGEVGARYALRQTLIDLASCCELMADRMPAPRRPL